MKAKKILIITDKEPNIQDSERFRFILAKNDEQAIEMAHQDEFDAILLEGVNGEKGLKLQAILPILQPEAMLLFATDLSREEALNQAFLERRKQRIAKIMVLDSTTLKPFEGLPVFSAN
jgi:hypothetical protein